MLVTYDVASEIAHCFLNTLLAVQASPDLILIVLHNCVPTSMGESCHNETSWRLAIIIYNTYYTGRILVIHGHVVCICIHAGINACITGESNKHQLSTSELGFPLEKESHPGSVWMTEPKPG